MPNRLLQPVTLLLFLLSSCEALLPPDNPIPAFLQVEPFELTTTPGTQGSASEAITEVWVRVDGTFLGVYDLPANIPILPNGSSTITLDAGVKENGIASTPEIYPFYTPVEIQTSLSPEQIHVIHPKTTYRAATRFAFQEGFEHSGHIFQLLLRGAEENRIQINQTQPFEGKASGWIELDSAHALVELATTTRYSNLLDKGAYVYLELNYQSDIPVSFGLLATSRSNGSSRIQYVAGFNPSSRWKKIYFNLSTATSGSISEDYQVILKAAIPLNADGTLSRKNARIQLDNLKLVHF